MGAQVCGKQVLYDRERVLQPLLREIALARQLSSSPLLIAWLENPDDLLAEYHGLRELERYRENFAGHNYFWPYCTTATTTTTTPKMNFPVSRCATGSAPPTPPIAGSTT